MDLDVERAFAEPHEPDPGLLLGDLRVGLQQFPEADKQEAKLVGCRLIEELEPGLQLDQVST